MDIFKNFAKYVLGVFVGFLFSVSITYSVLWLMSTEQQIEFAHSVLNTHKDKN